MMRHSRRKIFPVIIFVLFIIQVQGQFFRRTVNQYGSNGLKEGRWITYWDSEKKIPMSVVKYEEGRETGVCKEYHQNGIIRLKFRYGKDRIRVKYYSPEGELEKKGWSRMEFSPGDIHYYWHGKWKLYDSEGKLERIATYDHGAETSTTEPPG